jgi:hypothetical protein
MIQTKFPLLIFLTMLLWGGLLTGCGRIQSQTQDSADLNIDLSVEPAQPAVGPAQLIVTVTDAAGQPIDDASLNIEGNMTHAGMVPVFAQASGGENGRYAVPFEWTMGGDWVVTVEITLQNGQIITREFPITVQ